MFDYRRAYLFVNCQGPIAIAMYCNVLPAQLYCLGLDLKAAIHDIRTSPCEVIRRCLIPRLDGIGATRCPLPLESQARKRSGWGNGCVRPIKRRTLQNVHAIGENDLLNHRNLAHPRSQLDLRFFS